MVACVARAFQGISFPQPEGGIVTVTFYLGGTTPAPLDPKYHNIWYAFGLFNPDTIHDTATFADPIRPAQGIERVWVNGTLSYTAQGLTGNRAGRFLPRSATQWLQ